MKQRTFKDLDFLTDYGTWSARAEEALQKGGAQPDLTKLFAGRSDDDDRPLPAYLVQNIIAKQNSNRMSCCERLVGQQHCSSP